MHNIRISTLGCLVFQILMSVGYGHAADFQTTTLAAEAPTVLATSSLASVARQTTTMSRKQRREESLSDTSDDSGSLPAKLPRKKCSGGIKSRYCRSYHRNLKEQNAALEDAPEPELLMTPQTEAPPAQKVEAPPAPKIEAPPAPHTEPPPTHTINVPKITAVIPNVEVPKVEVSTEHKVHVPPMDSNAKLGDATYYGTGLGACGITSNDNSMIAAASKLLFDSFPGATANPNLNPICGRKVRATYQGKSVEVEVVDRCEGCAMYDLDFSPTAFAKIGAMERGRLHGMTWEWI